MQDSVPGLMREAERIAEDAPPTKVIKSESGKGNKGKPVVAKGSGKDSPGGEGVSA